MITNPTPQRALRGQRAHQPLPRVVNSAEHLTWLAGHLTERDRWLVRMFFEHKVFTTHQLVDLAFPSHRAANLRLLNLTRWGVLHRFQPHRDLGTHPMHYVLDRAGATLLAHEHGIDPSALNYSREREAGRAYSLQLAHTVGCNSLFSTLVRRSRRPGAAGRLTAWWSAARCGRHWGDIVTPDGYGRWHESGRDIEWFVEFDFGTEQLSRLAAKLHRYERLADTTGITTPILFWLPSPQREAGTRRVLTETVRTLDRPHQVPVATTNPTSAPSPVDMAEARWLHIDDPLGGRVPLTQLTSRRPAQPPVETGAPRPPDSTPTVPAPDPTPPVREVRPST